MLNYSCLLSQTLMELLYKSVAVSCGIAVVVLAWRALNWVWLTPRKQEKYMRQQGFIGNPYRVLFGDGKEMAMIIKEAISKPINISDDIVPRIMPYAHNIIQKHGKKNYFIWAGPKPLVNILNPAHIREVLNKSDHFYSPEGGNPLIKLIATGLVDYKGDQWAKHRKIITPAFNLERLKNMLPAFYLSCNEIMSKWEKLVATSGQCEVDVQPYLETLTSDAISRTAFGSSYEEGRRIFQLQKEQMEIVIKMAQSIYLPGMRFLPTKRNRRMKELAKEVKVALSSVINKRVNAVKTGETGPDDLLGMLLAANSSEIEHGNKNSGMSIDEVIEECKLFYIAGQQTTVNLLVWTMILLGHYQECQTRARDEVLHAFGNAKPHIEGLNHLKIVNMILLEVLRLYPPAAFLHRTMDEDTKLGETPLPGGTILQLPVILLHRDNDYWGDDAKEFKPERFAEGVSKATKKGAYFPFGWGPRICLGQNFAMLEAKMALAMILQRFSFALSPSYAHAPRINFTLEPQYGAHLILQPLSFTNCL